MKGDFSRFTYDKFKNYIGLLRQQGHVLLDSDWNEQSFLWMENFRQLTRDILGDFVIPLSSNEITGNNSSALKISKFSLDTAGIVDFKISKGLAYIAGYPYYLKKDISFRTQPDYPEPDSPDINDDFLIYIEIWMKTISYIDDDFIREPILSGPETCLRAKLVGQIKVVSAKKIENYEDAGALLLGLFPENRLSLSMKIDHSGRQIPLSFGEIEAGGSYSVQNLHLRLELHRGISLNGGFSEGIKWSDENCATVVRIQKILAPDSVLVEEPEAVSGSFLSDGDWIEIDNLVTELHRQGGQIAQIKKINQEDSGYKIELDSEIHPLLTRHSIGAKPGMKIELEPRLRRWSGYMTPIILEKPISLGKGIKAILHAPEKNFNLIPGDFWTFALRDRDYNKKYAPIKASPDGVKVYRYPLAIIKKTGKDRYGDIIDCRKFSKPLT